MPPVSRPMIPFVGERFDPRTRLGDYARQSGRDTAESIRRGGELSAQMWSGLGQSVSGSLRDLAAIPAQRQAAELLAKKAQREEQAYLEAEAAKKSEAQKAERLKGLTQMYGGRVPGDVLVQEFGARDAADINKAFDEVFPATKEPEPFTLNPGDTRFDGTGKQIASVPKPEPVEQPVNLQRETLMVGGKPTIVNFNPRTGKYADLTGVEVTVAPLPKEQAQGPQPAWQWVTRNGKEVYTNRVKDGDVPNTNRVKATEDERKTAGFYGQMSDAIALMDQLENSVSEKELYQIQSLPQEGLIGAINRGELSEAAKRYVRAFEQFTEARLRPVSGAAISDSEFARDRRTYARQFKETPALNKDRRTARNRALDSLRKRAGVALDDANTAASDKKNPNR